LLAKLAVHSSVVATTGVPPPAEKVAALGLEFAAALPVIAVAKSARSVQLVPFHCSVKS
jgi:hypothetical protein